MSADGGTVTIYDDGRCPFCQWVEQAILRCDRDHRLEFRDYHLHAAETPFPFDELHRAMHVRTSDGSWQVGFFGWIAILRALPRWRWLARLMSAPPLRWIGPLMYRVIAGNRYRIPGVVLRWIGAPPPCGPATDAPQTR